MPAFNAVAERAVTEPRAEGDQTVSGSLVTEVDSALAITKAKLRQVGFAVETDQVFAPGREKSRTTALLVEEDTVFAEGLISAEDLLVEVDSVFAPTRIKSRSLDQLVELDSVFDAVAQAIEPLLVEADSVFAVAKSKSLAVSQVVEIDSVPEDFVFAVEAIPSVDTNKALQFVEIDIPGFADANVPQTLRFAKPTDYLPNDIDCIASLMEVDYSPAQISLGKDLGTRAHISARLKDHRHSFFTEDFEAGTFFGKFRARYGQTLRGEDFRLRQGFLGQRLDQMEARHFIIEGNDGPDPQSGEFEFIAKDLLKLADPDRAQAPALSNGFLEGAINSSVTSATLSPEGIGNSEYPASGFLNIGGKEIVSFTRSGDDLTITRAQLGTTAQSHSAEDRCQIALRYSADDVADIIYELLNTYAGVDAALLPLTDWQDETELFLGRLYTGTVAEPTAVSDLLSELIEQAALAMWWDESDRQIKLRVLRAISTDATTYDSDNIIGGSLRIEEQPDKRLSKVWVYFAQINPLEPLDNKDNYRSTAESLDAQSETDFGSPAIKKIFSRWIPALGRATAERIGDIQIARFKIPPRRAEFELLKPDSDILLGGGFRLKGWPIQRPDGSFTDMPIQVTRLESMIDRYAVTAEEMLFTDLGDDIRTVIIDTDTNDFNLRSAYDLLYPASFDGVTVLCIVQSGVLVGGTSSATPAFDLGSWPAGLVPVVLVRGRIQGAGGKGGKGGNASNASTSDPARDGADGADGGVAILAESAVEIDASSGSIWGGGGAGGGGAGGYRTTVDSVKGGGGGGGAGTVVGSGGALGSVSGGGGGNGGSAGQAGTAQDGGNGGSGSSQDNGEPQPTNQSVAGGNGGAGGGPGQGGVSGTQASQGGVSGGGFFTGTPGSGGSAGAAIDGDSNVTLGTYDIPSNTFTSGATGTEDILGPQTG